MFYCTLYSHACSTIKYTKTHSLVEDVLTWQYTPTHEIAHMIGHAYVYSHLWKFSVWRFIMSGTYYNLKSRNLHEKNSYPCTIILDTWIRIGGNIILLNLRWNILSPQQAVLKIILENRWADNGLQAKSSPPPCYDFVKLALIK